MRDNNKNEMGKDVWERLWNRTILTSGFRKAFPKFDQLIHIYYRIKINKLLEGVNLVGCRILELGCGSGMNSVNFFKDHHVQKAVLVDFSKQALEMARVNTKHYNIDLVCSDIFSLNLNERFDLVFSVGLIEHFMSKRRNEAIKIHRKFTKNDGLIMIIVPRKCFFAKIIKLINQIQGYKEYHFPDAEVERLFDQNKLKVIKRNSMMLGAVSCYLLRPSK